MAEPLQLAQFVDEQGNPISIDDMRQRGTYTPMETDVDTVSPATMETLGSAYRMNSPVGSFMSSEALHVDRLTVEPDFRAYDEIQGTPYEQYADRFVDVRNRKHFVAVKNDIDRELNDRDVLRRSGWFGTVAEMGSSLVDPTILLPGGAFVRGARLGYSGVKSAAVIGAASVAGAGLSELALSQTQQTRTWEETASALAAAGVLGALIGGVGAKLLSRAEYNALSRKLATELATEETSDVSNIVEAFGRDLQAAGAQATYAPRLEDYTIDVGAARRIASVTAINPLLRTLQSMSAVTRSVSSRLMENPLYLRMVGTRTIEPGDLSGRPAGTVAGEAQEQAAETLMKRWRGALTDATREHTKLYTDAVKAGFQGTRTEFNNAVGRAMRREDLSEAGDDFVTRSAKMWRAKVFDPLKDEAIKPEVGLLPADVQVTTAASYLSRMYKTRMIQAREPEFKKIVRDWAQKNARKEYTKRKETHAKRLARIDQELADLGMSAADRKTALADLNTQIETLRAAHTDLEPALKRLSEIAEARPATADAATKAALDAEAKQIREAGGERLANFLTTEREMMGRRRRVRFNREGVVQEATRVRERLADIEEENIGRLTRLIRSVQEIEQQIARDSPERIEAAIKRATEEFNQALARSDAAYDRLAKARESDAEKIEKLRIALDEERGKLADPNLTPKQQEKLTARVAALEAKVEGKAAALSKAEDARFAKQDVAEAKRNKSMAKAAQKLSTLATKDPEKAVAELKKLIDQRVANTAKVIAKAEREAVKLSARLDTLDPKRIEARMKDIKQRRAGLERRFADVFEIQRDADDDFVEYAGGIADNIFNQLTGRDKMNAPNEVVPALRGPLKERTFGIKDKLIEDFLESDVEEVAGRYVRTMGADVELARKFGSADMKKAVQDIKADYDRLRARLSARTDMTPVEKEHALPLLHAAEARDLKDIEGVRDILRGTYLIDRNNSTWGRITRSARAYNYLRMMGDVVLSSLTDAARPIMVHGLGRFIKGAAKFAANSEYRRLSAEQGRKAGVVSEIAMSSRLATIADLTDPYIDATPFDRFLENSTRIFSKLNGMTYWNDFMKTFTTGMSQDRIVGNIMRDWTKLPERERRYLLYLGINESTAARMRAQVERAAGVSPSDAGRVNGVWYAGDDFWDDDALKSALQGALAKDVDSIIIAAGAGDLPLIANDPTMRVALQFKTFALASHQRAFLRAVQEGARGNHWAVVNGMLAMTMIGMFIYSMKAVAQNKIDQLSDNPGKWIAEGLDRSGMFALMFELSNMSEKAGGVGIHSMLQAAFDAEAAGEASRYASRNFIGSMIGPTAGTMEDVARLYGFTGRGARNIFTGRGEVFGKADVNAGIRLIPGYSLPVVRSAIEWGAKPYAYEAIGD